MPPSHITVTGVPGRHTPIHRDDGTAPGGALLYVCEGQVDRVRYSQAVRRSIARGDMLPCDMDGAPVASVDLADAPIDISGRVTVDRSKSKKGPQR
jgi:hypothetical protein